MGLEIRKLAEEYGKRLLCVLPAGEEYPMSRTGSELGQMLSGLQNEHTYSVFEISVFQKTVEKCRKYVANPSEKIEDNLKFPNGDMIEVDDMAGYVFMNLQSSLSRLNNEEIKNKVERYWDDAIFPAIMERIEELAQDYFYSSRDN